jgi:hypothetical protein
MRIRKRKSSSGRPPNADEYVRSFARQVHELIALGVARLAPRKLAGEDEEAITGYLVREIRGAVEDGAAPAWAWRYTVHDDPPVNLPSSPARPAPPSGRRRPRIDLVIEQCARGAHARFGFEAKRLRDRDSVAAYVGADGLGALTSGYYGDAHRGLGMLGYVQVDKTVDWIQRVEARLHGERKSHGIAASGPPWSPGGVSGALRLSLVSEHTRATVKTRVYHTFLRCC